MVVVPVSGADVIGSRIRSREGGKGLRSPDVEFASFGFVVSLLRTFVHLIKLPVVETIGSVQRFSLSQLQRSDAHRLIFGGERLTAQNSNPRLPFGLLTRDMFLRVRREKLRGRQEMQRRSPSPLNIQILLYLFVHVLVLVDGAMDSESM